MSSTSTTWTVDTNTKSGGAQTFSTSISSLKILGEEGSDAILRLFADEGDDNADQWRLVSSSSTNKLNFMSLASGSWSTVLDLYGAGGAVVFNEDSADIDFRVESNGNANMLFVDGGNNRVGIGTSSPVAWLDIHDTTASSTTTGGSLRLAESDGAALADNHRLGVLEFASTEDATAVKVGAYIEAIADGAWTAADDYDQGTDLLFFTQSADASDSNGFTSPRMTINSAGNVGIGTAGPDNSLEVIGLAQVSHTEGAGDHLTIQPHTDGLTYFNAYGAGAGEGGFVFRTDDGGTDSLHIAENGRVGINDTSPDNQLHVTNTSGVTKEVVKLEQLDDDEPFILFTGTTASDQTKSLSTETSVGSIEGHVLVSINGADKWIAYYAKN